MLEAIRDGGMAEFLAGHPSAAAFVRDLKASPRSFSTERFWAVHAYRFVSGEGVGTFVRYCVEPVAGFQTLGEEELEGKGAEFLFEDIKERVEAGGVGLMLRGQVAGKGDVTDDATVHWPEERKVVDLGTLILEALVEDSLAEEKKMIFDPIPRVEGLERSADPLLDVRAGAYLISGRERRAA